MDSLELRIRAVESKLDRLFGGIIAANAGLVLVVALMLR